MYVHEPFISWKHFEILYKIDHPLPLSMCPKLTESHIYLSNSAKMRVRLAVQVTEFNFSLWITHLKQTCKFFTCY